MTQTVPPQESQKPAEELKSMTFGEHLLELRRRLVVSVVVVVVAMLTFMFMKQTVTEIVLRPYRQAWQQEFDKFWTEHVLNEQSTRLEPDERKFWLDRQEKIRNGDFPNDTKMALNGFPLSRALVSLKVFSDVFIWMAASALAGLIVAAPIVLYQIWQFVAAGLYAHEKQLVLRYVPLSVTLFAAGVLFGYFVMIPFTIHFMVDMMAPGAITPMFGVGDYFSFLFTVNLALAVLFQLPLVMMVLARIGLVPEGAYTKYWRHAVLIIFVVAGLLTPPDPFTQSFVAVPMIALYVLGIFLSKGSAKKAAAAAH